MKDEMNYRLLKPEEYDKLSFIFEPRGLPLPDPELEAVGVAENGKINGMIIRRLLPLIDGLWADPEHRGGRIDYPKLIATVEEPLIALPGSRAYAFATGKHVAEIASQCGYKPLKWRVFEKEF